MPSPPKKNRVRSQTVSSESGTLPVRGKRYKRGISLTSRDDNFDTEFKREEEPLSASDGMMSYFSQQDLEDIFKIGGTKSIFADKIDPLKETEGEEEKGVGQEGVVKEEQEEEAVKEEGEKEDDDDEKDEEASEPSSSVESSHVGSPEQTVVIEPTIIPDDIPPDVVRGHQYLTIACGKG